MSNKYTLGDVAKHSDTTDMWMVIHGTVYDLTRLSKDFPHPIKPLKGVAGKEATTAFDDVGHSSRALKMMQQYKVGELVAELPSPPASLPPPLALVSSGAPSGSVDTLPPTNPNGNSGDSSTPTGSVSTESDYSSISTVAKLPSAPAKTRPAKRVSIDENHTKVSFPSAEAVGQGSSPNNPEYKMSPRSSSSSSIANNKPQEVVTTASSEPSTRPAGGIVKASSISCPQSPGASPVAPASTFTSTITATPLAAVPKGRIADRIKSLQERTSSFPMAVVDRSMLAANSSSSPSRQSTKRIDGSAFGIILLFLSFTVGTAYVFVSMLRSA